MLLTRDRSFYKDFLSLMLFIALQNAIVFGVNLADNIMLGNYSQDALSGAALANQVQFLLQMIIGGVGEGVVVLASQYWGKRELDPIRRVVGVGVRMGALFGLVFLLAGLLLPRPILRLLCSDPAVLDEGVTYLRIVALTYLPFCLSTVLLAALRSVEIVKIGFVTSLATLVINVGLNYVLIFGHLGLPRLGAAGAALATLISRLVELAIILVFALGLDKRLKLRFRHLVQRDRLLYQDFIRVAMPVVLSGAIWGVAMFVQTAILGHMGADAIAANSIAASLFSLISVVSYGAANAASVFTGKTVGSGNMEKLREYVNTMQILFLVIGLLSGAALFAFKDLIVSTYDVTDTARTLADQFVSVLSVTLVGTSYQVACLTGIVRGGGHTRFVLYNDLIFMWLIVLPSSALAAYVFKLSPLVVFICLKSDQILKCFVAVVEVNRYTWVRKLTREAQDPPAAQG